MGFGDFKLLAALGAWTGWQMLPVVIVVSAGAGRGDRRRSRSGYRQERDATRASPSARTSPLGGIVGAALGPRGGHRLARALPGVIAIGLTGGIGSGKSHGRRRASPALGADVVDTDEISRGLTGPAGGAMPALRAAFGDALRRARTARSTARPCARSPSRIPARARGSNRSCIPRSAPRPIARLAAARGPYAVLVVPLLFETGGYAGPRRAHARGRLRRGAAGRAHDRAAPGLAEAEVRAIMAAQWPRWRRLQAADDVIWNGGDAGALDAQCDAAARRLSRRSAAIAAEICQCAVALPHNPRPTQRRRP